MQGNLEVGIYYSILCLTSICLYSPNESDLYNLFFTCHALLFLFHFFLVGFEHVSSPVSGDAWFYLWPKQIGKK